MPSISTAKNIPYMLSDCAFWHKLRFLCENVLRHVDDQIDRLLQDLTRNLDQVRATATGLSLHFQ